MDRPQQLIKAIAYTTVGVLLIGLIYFFLGAVTSSVLLGLALGLFAAIGADVLLFVAIKNPKSWVKFYAMRVAVIVIAVLLGVLLSVFDPTTTVLALIISLPAVAISGIERRKTDE